MATDTFIVYASLEDLMYLPQDSEYLFYNYNWQPSVPDSSICQCEESEYTEAAALYHELWKLRVSSLKRNWN